MWEHAFTPASLKGYEGMLVRRVSQLVDVLDGRVGKELDLSAWLGCFACVPRWSLSANIHPDDELLQL